MLSACHKGKTTSYKQIFDYGRNENQQSADTQPANGGLRPTGAIFHPRICRRKRRFLDAPTNQETYHHLSRRANRDRGGRKDRGLRPLHHRGL